ncbi:hypothetical protein NQD34_016733 [Periophthalmus magnuspinnatus]|nr:hypothetical protein NQD34_016733 [Periophthalmus magnuspinnatus]
MAPLTSNIVRSRVLASTMLNSSTYPPIPPHLSPDPSPKLPPALPPRPSPGPLAELPSAPPPRPSPGPSPKLPCSPFPAFPQSCYHKELGHTGPLLSQDIQS